MADFAPQFALGEDIDGDFNGGSLVQPVTYDETIGPGSPLVITGDNTDTVNVELLDTAVELARYIAILFGDQDDIKEALLQGRTKVVFGAGVTAGAALEVNASGQFINHPTGGSNAIVGFALQDIASGGDLGLIYFNGTLATRDTGP